MLRVITKHLAVLAAFRALDEELKKIFTDTGVDLIAVDNLEWQTRRGICEHHISEFRYKSAEYTIDIAFFLGVEKAEKGKCM